MSFGGAIRPLPGQPGYGQRESDKLAEETREMQINLMKLQEQMKRVKSKTNFDSAAADNSGGRWRSARSDRGGLRKYNTDIKNGTVKRNSRSKRGGPREMTNSSGDSRRRTFKHQVHQWTGREVTMWLKALDLSSYIETFARNEITGSVLLELGQSDLDYMNIKALGHRKIIMREIERLKRGKSSVDLRQGGTIDASPPRGNSSNNGSPNGRGRKQKRLLTVNNSESNLKVQGTSTNTSPTNQRFRFAAEETSPQQIQRREQRMREQQQTSSSPKTKKHWSHVKPISENEITGDGTVPVNLADGNYDESKQQSLFQQAVMEWRNPKQTATSSSSSSAGGLAAGGSMWNNPFEPSQKPNSLSNGTLDVEAEQKKFQQAVMEWRNGGKSSPTTHTPPATRNSSSSTGYEGKTSEHTIHAVVTKPRHTKFDGTLDEAGEHEKFRDAVTAWRNGNCKKSPVSSASVANELMLKMAEEDRKRREKFQLEKEELEREMRRERDALAKRREDAASKLAASKYSEDAVGGKHQEDRNDGSATARRRKYEKWSDVAGIEIEY